MITVLIVIHLMLVVAMIGVIMLQKSEGGGLGAGGSTGGFLSSRGTANILTRTTAVLAGAFFATSLLLSVLAGWDRKPHSIIEQTQAPPAQQTPSAPTTGPVTPPGQGGGLLDTLRRNEQQPPPPAPPGPQVPRSE